MTRQEAIAAGAKRYHGKVCAKHPELGGGRHTGSKTCLECARERYHERMKNPIYREKERERLRNPVYRERHRERWRTDPEYREQNRAWHRERWRTDPEHRIRHTNANSRRERMARIARLDQELNELWAS